MDVGSLLTLGLLALFLAAQPWSVLAAVLLVTSQRGVVKESAYAAGWVTALSVVAFATVLLYPAVPPAATTSHGRALAELVLGLVLAGWLTWRWRHPKEPGTRSEPSWLSRLDTMSPVLAYGLGAFLPTYAVVVAAVSEMLSSGLSQGALTAVAAGWVVLAPRGWQLRLSYSYSTVTTPTGPTPRGAHGSSATAARCCTASAGWSAWYSLSKASSAC